MKKISSKRTQVCSFLIAIIFMFSAVTLYAAEENKTGLPFDSSMKYDVYFSAKDGNLKVIKNVAIEIIVNIQGNAFLIIRSLPAASSDYSSKIGFKDEKGYIRMESIVTILPAGMVLEAR